MPYNCDHWKTKELVNLRIPVASLFRSARQDWHPERLMRADETTVRFQFFEGYIEGTVIDGVLLVTAISLTGEGSGFGWHEIVEPALQDSYGKLVAVRIWEGGDSIDRVTVIDGVVTYEQIEL
jgi:hypothetical protein